MAKLQIVDVLEEMPRNLALLITYKKRLKAANNEWENNAIGLNYTVPTKTGALG